MRQRVPVLNNIAFENIYASHPESILINKLQLFGNNCIIHFENALAFLLFSLYLFLSFSINIFSIATRMIFLVYASFSGPSYH